MLREILDFRGTLNLESANLQILCLRKSGGGGGSKLRHVDFTPNQIIPDLHWKSMHSLGLLVYPDKRFFVCSGLCLIYYYSTVPRIGPDAAILAPSYCNYR